MVRLDKETWKNIIRNVEEDEEVGSAETLIEVTWLDGSDEWVLNFDVELFEDGFSSEEEASKRLEFVLKEYR